MKIGKKYLIIPDSYQVLTKKEHSIAAGIAIKYSNHKVERDKNNFHETSHARLI